MGVDQGISHSYTLVSAGIIGLAEFCDVEVCARLGDLVETSENCSGQEFVLPFVSYI
jgi:hypothetical protein